MSIRTVIIGGNPERVQFNPPARNLLGQIPAIFYLRQDHWALNGTHTLYIDIVVHIHVTYFNNNICDPFFAPSPASLTRTRSAATRSHKYLVLFAALRNNKPNRYRIRI